MSNANVKIGTIAVLGLPAPIFYHRTRKWLLLTLLRQLAPTFITVEFRDFFGGDILCSLTYALGNLYLFGCLYSHDWDSPAQCSSSHVSIPRSIPHVDACMLTFS